jgi:hypothetical protein
LWRLEEEEGRWWLWLAVGGREWLSKMTYREGRQ